MKYIPLFFVLAGLMSCSDSSLIQQKPALELWYRQPADVWEEALPVGNGRLGAMVYGGVKKERIQFNEDTFWAGGPSDPSDPETKNYLPDARKLVFQGKYKEAQEIINKHIIGPKMMPYLPLGELVLEMKQDAEPVNYRRSLDLRTAIARVDYEVDGDKFIREVFSSPVDQALVVHMTSDSKEGISCDLSFSNEIGARVFVADPTTLVLSGRAPETKGREGELSFEAVLKVQTEGGSVKASDSSLVVNGARTVNLYLVAATSFISYKDISGDPSRICSAYMNGIEDRPYTFIRRDHIEEHQSLFNRVEMDFGSTEESELPTDERLQKFQESGDPSLVALYFQYGRYLLISSSRPGCQPANLQGLWNPHPHPPWDSKYTVNINCEMNYWPAEMANLSECSEPLFSMIRELSEAGKKSASDVWGVNGWVCHHNTDIWRATTPLDGASWGMWPTGGAWLTSHLWEHYLYTGDKEFLAEYYPIIKEASRFFVGSLVKDPNNGFLVTCPSISPENRHLPGSISICAGPSMDIQLIRDLFSTCITASTLLAADKDFSDTLKEILPMLPPDKIGAGAYLQEWQEDWDMDVPEIQHRHLSHLYGLYPGHQFNQEETPDLWNACRKSLEIRGDGGTGWALAWKVNLWARLRDGEHAFQILKNLLTPCSNYGFGGPGGSYSNLFDACPPFQIDGNFGATAGIGEMLLQSQGKGIELLAALPHSIPKGDVSGLVARGGFELNFSWELGELKSVDVLSRLGNPLNLRYKGMENLVETSPGGKYSLNGELKMK